MIRGGRNDLPVDATTRPPPETRWWAETMSRAEWTARQQLKQIRMNASGSTLMPYSYQPKKSKPSWSARDDEDA